MRELTKIKYMVISIHALLAESDPVQRADHIRHCVFLSTLSLRRATFSFSSTFCSSDDFYPRSPCGERRLIAQANAAACQISIHALLAESDSTTAGTLIVTPDFYPRSPCGERQQKCTKQWGTFARMKQILWGLHLHADRQGCILPFLPLFFPYFLVRRNRGFYDRLPLALSKQDSILIKIRVQPHMLDFAFVMVSQLIKAQAVRF